jgi:broad specificity phosphatase PhoE
MNNHSTHTKSPHLFAFTVVLFLVTCLGAIAGEPLKIYYLRHAEGGHNVMKEWKDTPKEQWPPYVGNQNAFSPKGEQQVEAVTQELQGMKFDFIAVSPLWRTRNTILPYLKVKGVKGEIWPELMETINTKGALAKDLPPPSPTLFSGSKLLKVTPAEAEFFTFREDGNKEIKLSSESPEKTIADAVALSEKAVALIKERFSQSGKSILLVGHGNAGGTLGKALTGATMPDLGNTKIWMAEEQPDGSFKLKILNGNPVGDTGAK